MASVPAIIKPDMKSFVWLALGFFVAPKILAKVRP